MNDYGNSTIGIAPVPVAPATTVAFLKNKVMLALPWGKMTNPMTAFCTAQLMDKRRTVTALNFGDAFVAHSRNSIVDLFLKSTSEHLLMLDDDMLIPFGHAAWFKAHSGWENLPEPFASFNAIDRLLSHGKTVVGALYRGRYKTSNFVYGEGHNASEREYALAGPYDLVKETRWVGTGCIMIHRSVFESVEKKFPQLARGVDGKGGQWFTSSEHNLADAVRRTRQMLSEGPMTAEKGMTAFQMLIAAERDAHGNSTLGMGEDVAFSVRARQSGHPVFIDMGLRVGHLGSHCY